MHQVAAIVTPATTAAATRDAPPQKHVAQGDFTSSTACGQRLIA